MLYIRSTSTERTLLLLSSLFSQEDFNEKINIIISKKHKKGKIGDKNLISSFILKNSGYIPKIYEYNGFISLLNGLEEEYNADTTNGIFYMTDRIIINKYSSFNRIKLLNKFANDNSTLIYGIPFSGATYEKLYTYTKDTYDMKLKKVLDNSNNLLGVDLLYINTKAYRLDLDIYNKKMDTFNTFCLNKIIPSHLVSYLNVNYYAPELLNPNKHQIKQYQLASDCFKIKNVFKKLKSIAINETLFYIVQQYIENFNLLNSMSKEAVKNYKRNLKIYNIISPESAKIIEIRSLEKDRDIHLTDVEFLNNKVIRYYTFHIEKLSSTDGRLHLKDLLKYNKMDCFIMDTKKFKKEFKKLVKEKGLETLEPNTLEKFHNTKNDIKRVLTNVLIIE